MKRRSFLKTAGYTAAAYITPKLSEKQTSVHEADLNSVSPEKHASVVVQDNKVYIKTHTLTAVIEKGVLTSLMSIINGEEFIENPDVNSFRALQLLYSNNEIINVNEEKFGSTETRQISDRSAEIVFHSWEGDGVLFISVDVETGDLLIEPSAYSSRPGVRACRWSITGLKPNLELVAPFFQSRICR